MKLFDPDEQFILKWKKTFLLCSVISLSLDPLFLYIPIVDGTKKCLDVDHKLEIIVCVLRTFADILFVVHIIIQFRTKCLPSNSQIFGRGILIDDPYLVARLYLTSSYFFIDVLAALPLPQLAILVIIPNSDDPTSFLTEKLLKIIILCQYVPRVIQFSLFNKKVTKISGFLIQKAWSGAAFNFFLYVLASHVVGAMWYLFAIESEVRCWNIACQRNNCDSKYLYCGEGRVGDFGFLNTSCPLLERNEFKDSTNYDFGIFLDALQTRVLQTRDFPLKVLYCSLWGLQSLSSLGQGLKASTFYGEILFAYFIAIIGLVLFALLIGNMQKYLQSFSNASTLTAEEMKDKKVHDLMSRIFLPEELKDRVRRHRQYKWEITRGVALDSFFKDLPRDLRRDIKRHLCFSLLRRVPLFEAMDEHLMDALCDLLKPVLYTKYSHVLREGDPIPEMLFVTRGTLESVTDGGTGRIGFFNHSLIKAGDFCGEELLTWAFSPVSTTLPFATRSVRTLTNVEGFALVADDLKFVASQFSSGLNSMRFQHMFRFQSQQWRAWAARYIQAAWRRHYQRKHGMERSLQDDDALVTGNMETSTLSLGATTNALRFSSNVLRMLRQNRAYDAQQSTSNDHLILPLQPSFKDDATIRIFRSS